MSSFPLPLLTLTRTLRAPHWFLKKPIVVIFGHDFDVSGGLAPNPSPPPRLPPVAVMMVCFVISVVLLEVGCSSNGIGTTTLDNDGPQVPKMFGLVVVALSIGGHTAK
ncbi:hypothetical protein MUK42_16820 [Musa troglodytarum]|uniref:Uncharacterized protein n=1 Tax=Musa troglodytarum TaxID=320322 RepID=A0A9E7JDU3_9LILI|nr:hypothetical protein MUK42_16820 [Musa troglodytarum]